jgi:hypothetical protein
MREIGPKKGRAPDLQLGNVHTARKKHGEHGNMGHDGTQYVASDAGFAAHRGGEKGNKTVG